MRGKWREVHLGDVAEIVMGQSPPGSTYNESGDGLPFFQGVKDFGYRNPTPRVFCSRPSRVAQPGDILFSVRAPIGRVNIADRECTIGRGLSIIQPRDKAGSRYIEFALRYLEPTWQAIEGGGSVFGNATRQDVELLSLTWPDEVSDRRIIAEVLGSLDDKIELNRRMNATLESMARAVFKAWFVESEEAKGWKAGTVDEDFSLIMGQSPPGETYNEEKVGIPFFQGRADFGFRFPTNRVYCTAPTRFAKPGDTLVSVRAPVGDINMVAEKCAIGRGVAAIRHKTGSRSYTYYSMHMLKEEFNRFEAEGTVFGSINKADFQALKVKIPPPDKVLGFEEICYPIDQQVENNKKQSYTLASLRDALLPRLMSGEMRVRDSVNQ